MSNEQYIRDTGLKYYTKYAAGAGYMLSMAMCNTIYSISQVAEMRKWRSEDTTVGHWVSSIDHIPFNNHQVSLHHCCASRFDYRKPSMMYHPIKDLSLLANMAHTLTKGDSRGTCKLFQPKDKSC